LPDKKKGIELAPNGFPAMGNDLRKLPMITDLRAATLMAIRGDDRFEQEKPRIQELLPLARSHYKPDLEQNTLQNTLDDLAAWPWDLIRAIPDTERPTQPNRNWIVYSLHHRTIRQPLKARFLKRIHYSYHQNPSPPALLDAIGMDVHSQQHRLFESLEELWGTIQELAENGYIIGVPSGKPDPDDEWFLDMHEEKALIRQNPNCALAPLPRTESEIRYIELLAAISSSKKRNDR
jgi:hypothetical protein